MSTWFVTIAAIAGFVVKATGCMGDVKDADSTMNAAAKELLSMWEGDAANAFSAEQEQLTSFVKELVSAVSDYIGNIEKAKKTYESMMEETTALFK